MNTQQMPTLEPKAQFVATLTFTSDWHIGQGAGRPGNIDRLIQRDLDGLPMVPAKTLTGVWRDACEAVALGLDNGQSGPWSAWVNYLFGDQPALTRAGQPATQAPQAAALSIRAACFSDDFKRAIATNRPLLDAITFIKPGIQIEAKTGCAKDDHLRFEEMARAGATLRSPVELRLDGLDADQQHAAYALLVAATQWIERIGGKRRRGAGRCRLSLDEPVADWLAWIQQHPTPALPKTTAEQRQNPRWETGQTSPTVDASDGWVTVSLKLTTRTPLVIARRTLGNVVETLDYIPGTHLLRLVVQRLKTPEINVGHAISTQQLIVTNATLEINQQRGKPVPLALFGTKRDGGLAKGGCVYNRFVQAAPGQGQLKGERGGYLCLGQTPVDDQAAVQDALYFDDVARAVVTHNTIEDARQQPTEEVGGVYSYQAIVPDTVFRAEVRLTKTFADQLDPDWWQKLSGKARLGQSKKDGYGQVDIEVLSAPAEATETIELPGNQLTVWLQSDLLLRDQRLRPTATVQDLTQALSHQLGCELTLRAAPAPSDEASKKSPKKLSSLFARSHRLESWQVRWGLPRPSLAGLAAGSCFVFEWPEGQSINPEKLIELAIQGLGERCVEGYGQVCFNPPLLTQPTSEMAVIKGRSAGGGLEPQRRLAPTSDQHPDTEYARLIEKAAWRETIARAAQALCATPEQRQQYLGFSAAQPAMSQLGSLRTLLAQIEGPQHSSTQAWLDRVREKRADRWPDGSLDKLSQFLNQKEHIWQVLSTGLEQVALPSFSQLLLVENDDGWLKDQLWIEAVTSFIYLAMRAHKRDLEDNSTPGGTDHGTAA